MKQVLLFFILFSATLAQAQPPYSGTVFIDPDIITSSDPSTLQSTTYAGQGWSWMFDRRTNSWGWFYTYLFNVVWNDGITSVAQVNPEFGSVSAAQVEANKYAFLIGQLPTCLRVDVDEIWIHKGTQPFGGGNNSILIHTGQGVQYQSTGVLEEVLMHEACHTSLDATHAAHPNWINAQNADGNFISTYAQSYPTQEDIAESYVPWFAVRHRWWRISSYDYYTILGTIPNRLAYLDGINCSPKSNTVSTTAVQDAPSIDLYPNPAVDVLYIKGDDIQEQDVHLYNLLGQDLSPQTTYVNGRLDVSQLPTGHYVVHIKGFTKKIYKQ